MCEVLPNLLGKEIRKLLSEAQSKPSFILPLEERSRYEAQWSGRPVLPLIVCL